MQCVSPSTVSGKLLDGTGDVAEQNVGGWIMMPKQHWDAVQRALDKENVK